MRHSHGKTNQKTNPNFRWKTAVKESITKLPPAINV